MKEKRRETERDHLKLSNLSLQRDIASHLPAIIEITVNLVKNIIRGYTPYLNDKKAK